MDAERWQAKGRCREGVSHSNEASVGDDQQGSLFALTRARRLSEREE